MRIPRSTLADLPAPEIPDIRLHGGVNRGNIYPPPGRGVLLVVSSLAFLEGDTISVYWGDPAQPVAVVTVRAGQTAPLTIDVPAEKIQSISGTVAVWYAVYTPTVGDTYTSGIQDVVVDFNVPGDPDPNQATPNINENLAPIKGLDGAILPGQNLRIAIPRWKHTARGDRLTVAWGAENLPDEIIQDDLGEGGPDIQIDVPWTIVGRGPAILTYHILDIVSNHSLWAREVEFDAGTGGRHPAARILDTDDFGNLPIDALNFGPARVEVQYTLPSAGDVAVFTWSGITKEGITLPPATYSYTWPSPAPVKHAFQVPYDKVLPLVGGEARVSYTVQSAGTQPPPTPSANARALVTGDAVTLSPPAVKEAVGGELDPALLVAGATVQVSTDYAFASDADRITMFWRGESADGSTIVSDQQTRRRDEGTNGSLEFIVAKAKIEQVAGGRASVRYDVLTPANVVVPSDPLPLAIKSIGGTQPLPQPSVDGAASDNSLHPDDVGMSIVVRVPANPTLPVGSDMFVTWQGNGAGGSEITAAQPVNTAGMRFEVAKSVLPPNAGRAVNVFYTLSAGGVPGRSSDVRLLNVLQGGTIGNLPQPVVDESQGGQLDPAMAPRGCTVSLPAGADVQPGDSVIVNFGDFPLPPGPGPTFAVPPEEVARRLGQTLSVYYTVLRGGTRKDSDRLPLQVLDLVSNDPRIAPAQIKEANGTFILDLNAFAGDATAHVPQWPLMAAGQTCWLRVTAGGMTQALMNGEFIALAGPIERPLARAWLDRLMDNANLSIELKVGFDGGGEATARTYISPLYIVRARQGVPNFPQPSVPEAPNNTLPSNTSVARLRVPAHAQLLPGDVVSGFFGGSTLGSGAATPGVAMDFSIPGALIVGNTGRNVPCHYAVLRQGVSHASATQLIAVIDPTGIWDQEYDFNQDSIRHVVPGQHIYFPDGTGSVMDMEFDPYPAEPIPPTERLGVETYTYTPTTEFSGRCLYLGFPEGVANRNNIIFVNFRNTWDVVRFAVTSAHQQVTITFKDAAMNILSGVITIPAGDKTRQTEVRYDDRGRRRISHVELRAKDIIRLDSFKFRR